MKEKNYVINLMHGEEEFDGGLLSEIIVTPPIDLHRRVMDKVRMVDKISRRKMLFTRYLSAAAALFIFTVGIGAYLKGPYHKKNDIRIASEIKNNIEVTIEKEFVKDIRPIEKEKINSKQIGKNVLSKNNNDNIENLKKQKSIINTKSLNVKTKNEKINLEKDEHTAIVASSDKLNSQTNENDIQRHLTMNILVYHYELICPKDNKEVLEYFNENAKKVSEDIYVINKEKFEELATILQNNNIELKSIIEISNDVNEINIKLVLK